MAKREKGRPAGSRNRQYVHATAQPSRCPTCGSTEREAYFRTMETEYHGIDPAGQPYTHILRRWTHCAACGQARIDRSYELRVEDDATDDEAENE